MNELIHRTSKNSEGLSKKITKTTSVQYQHETNASQKLYVFLDSSCPSPHPPTPGHPCTAPGSLECGYPSSNCCCGQCEDVFYCASDSTTGVGIWSLRHVCPAGCGEGELWRHYFQLVLHFSLTLKPLVKGVVTSPNHPGNYPSLLEQKEKI